MVRKQKDLGTKELQKKRAALAGILPGLSLCQIKPAVFDGCVLHLLYNKDLINEKQLKIALQVRSFYYLFLRSRGVKSRISSASNSWGQINGKSPDPYEEKLLEKDWWKIQEIILGHSGFGGEVLRQVGLGGEANIAADNGRPFIDSFNAYGHLMLKIIQSPCLQILKYDKLIFNFGFVDFLTTRIDKISRSRFSFLRLKR